MISDKLQQLVINEYVLPNERLLSYKFVRKLNRSTQSYVFLLNIYVEDIGYGFCVERSILLGSSPRSPRK